jgi:hypothetical protein
MPHWELPCLAVRIAGILGNRVRSRACGQWLERGEMLEETA